MYEKLWRLLGACERLARDETAALTHRNFGALVETQQIKSALLSDLASEATLVHASCNSGARARLCRLLDNNRENARILSSIMEASREERLKMRAAAKQLRSLRASFQARERTQRPEAFNAHG